MIIDDVQQKIIDNLFLYFDSLNYKNIIIYGSFVEQLYGMNVTPNDIDIVVVMDGEPPEKNIKTFYFGIGIPVNVEFMNISKFENELNSLEPKYFLCLANDEMKNKINHIFKSKSLPEIRSSISAVSSRAFDKGKKKLLIEKDYDEVLGLKNIFHAFKFIKYAEWYYYPEIANIETGIETLNTIHTNIYETYLNSTGALAERCQCVLNYAKSLYNEKMTEFRILFPKEVNI